MPVAAAALLGLVLASPGAEGQAAQEPPSRLSITNLSTAPIPAFDGRLIVGTGLGVFGMVSRGPHETEPGLIVVEMLSSQTAAQLRVGGTKIDAMSFVFDLDCTTMQYRLSHQVSYERTGQPVSQTNLDNRMIEGPMASYLQVACGREASADLQVRGAFSSVDEFLTAADVILEPRRANLPRPTIRVVPRQPQN